MNQWFIKRNYMITSMTERVDFIELDSQRIAIIGQVYAQLFRQEQPNQKKKGERIIEQRSAKKPSDRLQEKLVKILEHLKTNIFSQEKKQRATQERVDKILKHFMNRDEEMAKKQMQNLSGEISTTMHVFLNCYFYQTIPLDNKYNLPLGRYFDAVIKSNVTTAQIQKKYNDLPYSQLDFFYSLHCQIIRLKDQSNKFQKFKAGRSQKEMMALAKTESMLDETYQKNRAIQERDKIQLKMDKVKIVLSEMAELQGNMANQKLYGTLGRTIQESSQEFRLHLRKIYLNFMDLSKRSIQRSEQTSFRTLLSELKSQNNSLKQQKIYLEQENKKHQEKIKDLENRIDSKSHQIYDKSKKEEELGVKIRQLEEMKKTLNKQVKQNENKVAQNKALTQKIQQLSDFIIEKQISYKEDQEQVEQNLKLARHSLRILSEQKDQQKLDYFKLEQKNAQLKKEMGQLRNQIIALKQQTVALTSQSSQPDSSTDEIITKLRTNQKTQKKNQDKLKELLEKQKAQRQETGLEVSKLRESNFESQATIRKMKEDMQKYEKMLQQKQGTMKIPDIDGENQHEADDDCQ